MESSPIPSGSLNPRVGGPSVVRALVVALATLGAAYMPSAAAAQDASGCDLLRSRNLVRLEAGGGNSIVYISRPVFACGGGIRIQADSAVVFTATNFSRFMGRVRFQEGGRLLTAVRANYFSRDGRLVAWEDARLEDPERGSVITGDSMRFLMANDFRPETELEVSGGRPHAVIVLQPEEPDSVARGDSLAVAGVVVDSLAVSDSAAVADSLPPPDSAGRPAPGPDSAAVAPPDTVPPEPFDLFADRLFLQGEGYLRAVGDVEVIRDSLEAFSDSLEYSGDTGILALRRNAQILSRAYSLSGDEVDLLLPGGEISEIRARRDAILIGDELDLSAPQVRLYLGEGTLERLVAVDWWELPSTDSTDATDAAEVIVPPVAADSGGLGGEAAPPDRPRADAQDFILTGDSLEVNAPAGELERVSAAGRARGESTARDSLNTSVTPEALRSDWIEGDTIVAEFVRVFARPDSIPDEEDGVALRRLTASGSAKSLYRLDPVRTVGDSTTAPEGEEPSPVAVEEEPPTADTLGVDLEGEALSADDVREPLPLHFVAGDRIIITMRNGEIEEMEVEGQTRGLYLEPNIDRRRGASTPGTGQGESG